MRSKDPERMDRILRIINDFFFREHRVPSLQEIAGLAEIAKSSAHRYLVEMDQRGLLSYQAGEILTEKIRESFQICRAPLLGGISCGEPVEENEQVEEYLTLPAAIFGHDELFILRARGDSMIGAGIESGDLVVMRRQQTARTGDIVAALVDHHENTLKRLLYDSERGCRYLHPENRKYPDMYFSEIEIQGVLANIIKSGPF